MDQDESEDEEVAEERSSSGFGEDISDTTEVDTSYYGWWW